MRLGIEEARALVQASMIASGQTQDEARIIADHLIDCELRGLSFGGLPRALSVAERMKACQEHRRSIRVVKETPVSATIDGGDNVGYLVAKKATDMAIAKARISGISIVGAYETWYTGMFSYYLEMLAKEGLAGMIAGSAPQVVAPHGGTAGRFGTNPIAFGFPTEGTPVIYDIGTSALMHGEVMLKMRTGEKLAPGQGFDANGRPTLDPAEALQGAISVWGGHKGSGLALSIQLLGMMAGASSNPIGVRDCGFLIVAIDPGLLTSGEDFRHRASEYVDQVRATPPLDPASPVRVPFDRSVTERERRRAIGTIEVPDNIVSALKTIAGQSNN